MILPDFLVQDTGDQIRIGGHRIGLHDVVHFYNEGCSAEELCEVFPTLPLPLVHKIIAFYLENSEAVDRDIADHDAKMERQRIAAPQGPDIAELRRRLAAKHAAGA